MLSVEKLHELLDYDPLTGAFRWKVQQGRGRVGEIAGSPETGRSRYWRIEIDGQSHKAHRLAWLYTHGVWPTFEIDHINRVKDDNRIVNLADKTHAENMANLARPSRPRRDNASGFLGVSRNKGRWRAHIQVDGKVHHLGTFDTSEQASVAYQAFGS